MPANNTQESSPESKETSGISLPVIFAALAVGSIILAQLGALSPFYALLTLSVSVVGLSTQLGENYSLAPNLMDALKHEKILSTGLALAGLGLVFGNPLIAVLGAPFIYLRVQHPGFTRSVESALNLATSLLWGTLDFDNPNPSPAGDLLRLAASAATQPDKALARITHSVKENPLQAARIAAPHAAALTTMLYLLPPVTNAISSTMANSIGAIVPMGGIAQSAVNLSMQLLLTYTGYNLVHRATNSAIDHLDYWTRKLMARTFFPSALPSEQNDAENTKKNQKALKGPATVKMLEYKESANNDVVEQSAKPPITPVFKRQQQHSGLGCSMSNSWLTDPVGSFMSIINPMRRKNRM